jgi:D-xylonolactonase
VAIKIAGGRMNMDPELIADYPCEVGENPLWHPDEQKLYWTDIPRGRLFRYDPDSGEHERCYEGPPVGGVTLQEDGALALFMARGAIRIWRDGFVRTIVDDIPRERSSRFNDVIADPEGRVFAGTMSTEDQLGRLYRIDPDGAISVVVESVGTSNGLGFTADCQHIYHTDTRAETIYIYDYDRTSGEMANRQVFARSGEGSGRPDGMTVAADDTVWSAFWDGGCVVHYSSEAEELGRIEFPVPKVSCPTFGGEDYGDMYVTTAGGDKRETDGALAGALFRVRDAAQGVAEFRSRLGL